MPPFSTEKRGTGCSLLEGCVQWPADAAARYRAKGYWKGETLGAHLPRWTAGRPDSVAVIAGEEQRTYGALDRHADSLAMSLGRPGSQDGDRILVQLASPPQCFPFIL